MIEHKSIHEAMVAAASEVGYVQKQRTAGLNYSYAGEASLIAALRPAMIEHGIYVYVVAVENVEQSEYETRNGAKMTRSTMRLTVRFQHSSGTFIDAQACGEGADSGDKSINKAMTGAYKYALRETFCIETGDDPDKYPSDPPVETKPAHAQAMKVDPRQAQQVKRQPEPEYDEPVQNSSVIERLDAKAAAKNGKRPYAPKDLKDAIIKMAGKHMGETMSDGARGALVGKIDAIFDGNEDDRHRLTKFLTGYPSTKNMPVNNMKALLDWIADFEMAQREAKSVIAMLDGEASAPLFPEESEK